MGAGLVKLPVNANPILWRTGDGGLSSRQLLSRGVRRGSICVDCQGVSGGGGVFSHPGGATAGDNVQLQQLAHHGYQRRFPGLA